MQRSLVCVFKVLQMYMCAVCTPERSFSFYNVTIKHIVNSRGVSKKNI